MTMIRETYWRARESWPELIDNYSPSALLRKMRANVAAWRGDCVILDDVRLRMGRHLSPALRDVVYSDRYERAERRMIAQRLEREDIVLEVGTGLGLIATMCARRIGSDRVFTFEANPALVTVIEETFALNQVAPRLYNCILGTGGGTRTFFVVDEFWSSSTVQRRPDARAVHVPVRDLRSTMEEIRPTFLIVDIEGGEWELFRDIDLSGVRKVSIELHSRVIGSEKTNAVRAGIAGAGLELVPEACSGDEQLFFQRPAA